MQVLKDYVRMNILESARKEFLSKGYAKASMRDIAQSANITVGNIYRYYDSKAFLFEAVVDPTFVEIKELIQNVRFDQFDANERQEYTNFRNEFVKGFINIVKENKEEIVILIKCAEGTRYRGTKNQFAQIFESKVNKYVGDIIEQENQKSDRAVISKVISKSVIDGLTELIVYNGLKDIKQLETDVRVLIDLYFSNLVGRFEL